MIGVSYKSLAQSFFKSLSKRPPKRPLKSRRASLCGGQTTAYCGWTRFVLAETVRLGRGAVSNPSQWKGAATT